MLISQLPRKVKKLAKKNRFNDFVKPSKTILRFILEDPDYNNIGMAFIWADTLQGHAFWDKWNRKWK